MELRACYSPKEGSSLYTLEVSDQAMVEAMFASHPPQDAPISHQLVWLARLADALEQGEAARWRRAQEDGWSAGRSADIKPSGL